jgi:peptidoglycan/xylan/chitin deacetylase (PgdA/CDA1 family)
VSKRLLVLGWHNVAGTYGFPSRDGAGQRGFAQQMRILSRMANVLPLNDALERLRSGEPLPARAVAITFDDGYRDNLTMAVPVLERLGLPATFFLVPGLLSGEVDAWWETLGWAIGSSPHSSFTFEDETFTLKENTNSTQSVYSPIVRRLKRRTRVAREQAMNELLSSLSPVGDPPDLFMDWPGAQELVSRGFSVQSHTCSHVVLGEETPAEQLRELTEARLCLQDKLNITISAVAYPQGGPLDYNADTVTAAGAAGYTWGVTTREGFATATSDPLEIQRCVMYPERGFVDLLAQLRYMLQAKFNRGTA